MSNGAFILSRYTFTVLEQYGDVSVPLISKNLFFDMPYCESAEKGVDESVIFWRKFFIEKKLPYVLVMARLKSKYIKSERAINRKNKIKAQKMNRKYPTVLSNGPRKVHVLFRNFISFEA